MRGKQFFRTPIATGISLALGATSAIPTFAEEAVLEEVTVTGIRSSLKRAMDSKRDAAGVVDGITSEDMGKFPDTNLAESLQRITGIAISRSQGEGSKITVRGWGEDFNLVTLNRRQLPTYAGLGRSFDFADLASDGVAAVEVYKTGKANIPPGGIGASVNIVTLKPLDNPGLRTSVGAKAINDTSTRDGDDLTPELSGMISQTFLDDTIGVSLVGSYQKRNNGEASSFAAGETSWLENPLSSQAAFDNEPAENTIIGTPRSQKYTLNEWERERTNGQLTLQWAPTEAVTATLDYTFAERSVSSRTSDMQAWFGQSNQSGILSDGPVVSPIVYTEQAGENELLNDEPDIVFGSGVGATKNELTSTGLTLEWNPTDTISLEFDYHDSTAESNPDHPIAGSAGISMSTFARQGSSVDYSGDIPVLTIDYADPLSPDDMRITGSGFNNNWSKMDLEQAQLHASWEFTDMGSKVEFGLSQTEVKNFTTGKSVQNQNWAPELATAPNLISDIISPASLTGVFDEFSSGDQINTTLFTANVEDLIRRATFLQNLPESNPAHLPVHTLSNEGGLGDCGTGLCGSSTPGFGSRFAEESFATYLQVTYVGDFMDYPYNIVAGVRYEDTDVTSSSEFKVPTGINWITQNEFVVVLSGEEARSSAGDYDYVLPNFDFDIELTEEMKLRASYSETIARQGYGSLSSTVGVPVGLKFENGLVSGNTISVGNPGLLPFESKNIDVSFEWYFADASYFSIGYYTKKVSNFTAASTLKDSAFFDGISNPATGELVTAAIDALDGSTDRGAIRDWIFENRANEPGVDVANGVISGVFPRDGDALWDINTTVNSDRKVTADGIEIAFQHDFEGTGFGMQINATFANGPEYDPTNYEPQFALPGLSDTRNFVGYYDKDGIQVRLAYNWRDTYYTGLPFEAIPTFVEDYSQWDFNASYELTDNINIFFEGINITNETTSVYKRSGLQQVSDAQGGSRWNFGARWTF